ncbi:hypothetical protein QBC33DRAFT_446420, partial [Phialemonium atrogriseum]
LCQTCKSILHNLHCLCKSSCNATNSTTIIITFSSKQNASNINNMLLPSLILATYIIRLSP